MNSNTALTIQFVSVFLIAILFLSLTNALKFDTLRHWKRAWLSLSAALLSLCVAFSLDLPSKPFQVLYYLGEYIFGYLLIAGCRSYAYDKNPSSRSWFLLIPAVLVSFLLAFPLSDFNNVFNFHSLILVILFSIAFFTLNTINKSQQKNLGLLLMKFALVLLSLDFLHYLVIFTLTQASYNLPLPNNYLAYNSIVDLVLGNFIRLRDGYHHYGKSPSGSRRNQQSA